MTGFLGNLAEGFEPQPQLVSALLALRPLCEDDRAPLAKAAADPQIWAGHPATERWRPEVFGPYFDLLLASGTALTVREAPTGRVIGTSRYYATTDAPGVPSVGFTFLTRDHWGGGTNFELKRLMFGHVFAASETVWLHIGPGNIRSQTATGRLGAVHDHDAMLDYGTGPGLRQCWRLERTAWEHVLAERA